MTDNIKKQEIQKAFSKPSDGSLPEISLIFPSVSAARETIQNLIQEASEGEAASIWDDETQKDILCRSLSKKELAEKFNENHHLLLHNLRNLPDLGLTFSGNCLYLDFRSGPEWTPEKVEALLLLIKELKQRYQISLVRLDDAEISFSEEEIAAFNSFF